MSVAVRMPQISMTMIDGTIVKWLKNEHDTVTEGEALVEIQTDKVVDTLNASAAGVIMQLVAREGDIVPVGEVLCLIGDGSQADEAPATPAPVGQPVCPVASAVAAAVSAAVAASALPVAGQKGRRASPLAKKVAAVHEVDLAGVDGTGPGGLIVKADVLKAAARAAQAASVPLPGAQPVQAAVALPGAVEADDEIRPFEGIRKTIAERLMLSKRSAAEVTTVADADMGAVREMRRVLPLSYTAFVILAAAKALAEYPIMNAWIEDERVILKKRINISVAVATQMGLLTPVIQDAGNKNLLTIGEDLHALAERGREGRLAARDFEGGTFTVTNSGVYGSILFTPIINHPQSAVLGLGRIAMTPVVRPDESIGAALMMYMSLTYNHRSIDGETAVKFLQRIRQYLEHPQDLIGLKRNA